jgi:hypothetical protein
VQFDLVIRETDFPQILFDCFYWDSFGEVNASHVVGLPNVLMVAFRPVVLIVFAMFQTRWRDAINRCPRTCSRHSRWRWMKSSFSASAQLFICSGDFGFNFSVAGFGWTFPGNFNWICNPND